MSTGISVSDVAILYDKTRIFLVEHTWAKGHYASSAVRGGLVATFGFANSNDWLVIAAAHWRSDIGDTDDAEAARTTAGMVLARAVAESLETADPAAATLIMGDFNAEPFDAQFGAALPCARSRAQVQRHVKRSPYDLLFYNAAWRWLGEHYPWDGAQPPHTLAGTYRISGSNRPTAWRTFDQILVSPSLLGNASWSLDESNLGVFLDQCVFDQVRGSIQKHFDHLPIVGHLKQLPSANQQPSVIRIP